MYVYPCLLPSFLFCSLPHFSVGLSLSFSLTLSVFLSFSRIRRYKNDQLQYQPGLLYTF